MIPAMTDPQQFLDSWTRRQTRAPRRADVAAEQVGEHATAARRVDRAAAWGLAVAAWGLAAAAWAVWG